MADGLTQLRRYISLKPILEAKNLTYIYSAGTPFEHKALDRHVTFPWSGVNLLASSATPAPENPP